jgi:hypothetical protein
MNRSDDPTSRAFEAPSFGAGRPSFTTGKRRLKISCDNCFATYWTTKKECKVFPERGAP